MLLAEAADEQSLLPCSFVTPDGFGPEFNPVTAVEAMLNKGVLLCWTDPQAEQFSPLPWCCGALYEALQSHCMPLLLDQGKITCDDLDVVLTNFPRLRIILINVYRQGRHRMLYPLFRRHENLWMCLGPIYAVHQGIEDLCRTFGHERWVFGTGYPAAE
ncbi:unnamed protein product, partial [marine sediment metagenome]